MIVASDYMAIRPFCEYPKGKYAHEVKTVLDGLSKQRRDAVIAIYSSMEASASSRVRAKAVKKYAHDKHFAEETIYSYLREARKQLMNIIEKT